MKRLITIVLLLICWLMPASSWSAARPDSQNGIYGCTSLTGGAQGALDALDQTGDGDTDVTDGTPNQYDLIDGDIAIVGAISGATTSMYFYVYDADGTDAESSPEVIRPNDYGSAGVWVLANYFMRGYSVSRDETPTFCFGDSDTTDNDNNVCLTVNCTDTGSGSEDCDLTISVQIAGTLTDVITIDADGSISFSNLSLAANTIDAITEIASGLKSGSDSTLVTGTAGTNTYVAVWNADGDLVAGAGAPQTGTDDDVPESGDFGAAAALDADGSLTPNAPITGDPDSLDITLSTNPLLYDGGYIRFNAAGEATLDAFTTAGQVISIEFYPSVAIIVNPDSGQTITRNGVALAQGEALINDSNYGLCTLVYLGTNSIAATCSDDVTEETP
jgi:hypothetical protein